LFIRACYKEKFSPVVQEAGVSFCEIVRNVTSKDCEKDNIMDDATNKLNISLEYRDDNSSFTSAYEDEGFAPLGFGNVIRIQSVRCGCVASYFYSV
jgi:hypothetical protein